MTKLFVVGFPREMDEMALAQLFGPHGDIDILTIVRDKFTKQSKGFGFIHMKDAEGAQMAIEALDGREFGDRKLEVRIAEDKPAPTNFRPQKRFPPRTNSYGNSGNGGGGYNKSYNNSGNGGYNKSYNNSGDSGYNKSYNNSGNGGYNKSYNNSGDSGYNKSYNSGNGNAYRSAPANNDDASDSKRKRPRLSK